MWKDIPWYEWLYQISDCNEGVKSIDYRWKWSIKLLKQFSDKDGYLFSNLSCCIKRVHRLVAQTFIPNPDNLPIVLHLDNDPSNNNLDNLKWGTKKENTKQMWNDWRANNSFQNNHPNLWKFGWKHPFSKKINQYTLSWEFIRDWYSSMDIQRELWVRRCNICNCCNWIQKTSNWYIWRYVN